MWETCVYAAALEREFVQYHVRPRFAHTATRTLALDHNKDHVDWMREQEQPTQRDDGTPDTSSAKGGLIGNNNSIAGPAVHWYAGGMDRLLDGALGVNNLHRLRAMVGPDSIVLVSEACRCPTTGFAGADVDVYWCQAERYAHTILADLAAGSQGL